MSLELLHVGRYGTTSRHTHFKLFIANVPKTVSTAIPTSIIVKS
jgi:hypothetical protein